MWEDTADDSATCECDDDVPADDAGSPFVPAVPEVPAIPAIPAVVDDPNTPGDETAPAVPAVPGTPGVPAIPAVAPVVMPDWQSSDRTAACYSGPVLPGGPNLDA